MFFQSTSIVGIYPVFSRKTLLSRIGVACTYNAIFVLEPSIRHVCSRTMKVILSPAMQRGEKVNRLDLFLFEERQLSDRRPMIREQKVENGAVFRKFNTGCTVSRRFALDLNLAQEKLRI